MQLARWMIRSLVLLGLIGAGTCAGKDPVALLDVKIGKDRLQGRIAAHNDQTCWLLHRDGRLSAFPMDDVTDFHEIEPKFRPFTSLDLRDQLQVEFGRAYEVKTTAHYVVVAHRGSADRYGTLFEQIYRQFHTYVSTRGFRMSEPEFPLIAVVLPDQQSFEEYCVGEGTRPQPGLVGFYLPGSNRIAVYDRAATGQSSVADVDDTVIHEGTHQIAYNTGVHSRIGQNPLWLVEGLATLLEADGVRKREVAAQPIDRVNPERFEWFREYSQVRRRSNSLEAFLRDDGMFKRATLDAYSQSWALTFYLAETRPAEFARYLKKVASRDPLQRYDGDARLKDFTDVFGRDLNFLEMGMLRFYEKLSVD